MYTLEDVYDQECAAVECWTQQEVLDFLSLVRENPPIGFQDYWLSKLEGGLGECTFVPNAPVCITVHECWHDEAAFGWCDRKWYENAGYTVFSFDEIVHRPRELVAEGLDSLFDSEVL